MRRVNIHTVSLDRSQEQPGYAWSAAVLGPHIGAEGMGATLYELPAGQASFPITTSTAARSGCWW